ncbi:hypothetical protein BH11PLA2_BH11PLA2_51700 [soil metagenome]
MFLTADATCIEATESHGQRLVAAWLEAAGLPANCWPLEHEAAAAVLAAGGYAIDPEQLRTLGERGQVPSCELWDARDLLAAASALEGRRQWQPNSVHDPKKPAEWLALETNTQAGPAALEAMRQQLRQLDLRLTMVLLVECDSRAMREKLFASAAAILATDHEVTL